MNNKILTSPLGENPFDNLYNNITEYQLKNGLKVILKEVHSNPIVSVWLWYKLGSANESLGFTGAAHFIEHMNFKGTEKFDKYEMVALIDEQGGDWNGFTWLDQTAYFETLPSSSIDIALELEAQRMLFSKFELSEFESEKKVIISELQECKNAPTVILDMEVNSMAFKVHPYRWPVIGWLSDIKNMTKDELLNFYKRYYLPNNAVLVIVGDFNKKETIKKIDKYFGKFPSGEKIKEVKIKEPLQEGERRVTIEKKGTVSYIQLSYHIPSAKHIDFYPLLVMDAILGGAKGVNPFYSNLDEDVSTSSRLYKALIDKKLASKVSNQILPTKSPWLYNIYVTVEDGVNIEKVEKALFETIEKLKVEEISEKELQKAINQIKAKYIFQNNSVTEIASQLGYLETIGGFKLFEKFIDKILSVTPNDVKKVAKKYLIKKNRNVGWFVALDNENKEEIDNKIIKDNEKSTNNPSKIAHFKCEQCIENQSVFIEKSNDEEIIREVLPNGMVILIKKNNLTPSVCINIGVHAGGIYDSPGKEGLANFVASLLDKGSKNFTASDIAEKFDFIGGLLSIEADKDLVNIEVTILKENFDEILNLLYEILTSSIFPEEEVDKIRGKIITEIKEGEDSPLEMAEKAFYEITYPITHPYHSPIEGTIKSIKSITREDIVNFYNTYYYPEKTVIAIVGDIEPKMIIKKIKEQFSLWDKQKKTFTEISFPQVEPLKTYVKRIIQMKNKTYVELIYGFKSISRKNPDYYAFEVMNTILGRFGMGGRLGSLIREEKGLAYSIDSYLIPSLLEGPFMVCAGVSPTDVEITIDLIKGEIEKIKKEGVTQKELTQAKGYLTGYFYRIMETNEGYATILQLEELFSLGYDYTRKYKEYINSITVEDVIKVAQTYLHTESYALTIAGPYKE